MICTLARFQIRRSFRLLNHVTNKLPSIEIVSFEIGSLPLAAKTNEVESATTDTEEATKTSSDEPQIRLSVLIQVFETCWVEIVGVNCTAATRQRDRKGTYTGAHVPNNIARATHENDTTMLVQKSTVPENFAEIELESAAALVQGDKSLVDSGDNFHRQHSELIFDKVGLVDHSLYAQRRAIFLQQNRSNDIFVRNQMRLKIDVSNVSNLLESGRDFDSLREQTTQDGLLRQVIECDVSGAVFKLGICVFDRFLLLL